MVSEIEVSNKHLLNKILQAYGQALISKVEDLQKFSASLKYNYKKGRKK
jgi:hypothetical protein